MISDSTLLRVLPKSTVDLVGDLVRGLLWGLVAIVWLAFLQVYARLWRLPFTDPSSDFTIFYYTGRMVADGLPMYGASPAPYGIHWEAGHLGNLNPPHFQLLFHPLALLSYGRAFIVWTVLSLAALAMTIVLIVKALGVSLTWSRALGAGALIVSSAAFTTVAVTWELTFFLMLPFTLAWIAARNGRWGSAGAWLGVCASFKLFFLLFVPWLVLQRRWRALGAGAAAAVACVLAGSTAYGIRTYAEWLDYLRIVGWEWIHMNASWPGLVARAVRGHEGIMAAVWQAPALERGLSLAGSAIVCAVSLIAAWRVVAGAVWGRGLAPRPDPSGVSQAGAHGTGPTPRLEPARQDLAWLILLLAAVLASPLGWVYYMPLALGPLAGVLVSGTWKHLPPWGLLAIGIAAIGLWVPQEVAASRQPSALATLTLASSYFYATAALWLGALAIALRTMHVGQGFKSVGQGFSPAFFLDGVSE